ncbi:hypothetical protein HYC85_014561 [Camellia sinensis]|uniref:F-box domain-containing protein n=1 Tax=Camellia sinensis TaxID=4442 RepID=A0A7J7H9T1_CAMSI|nr:hypothetical protein HYC85_014561 [Camellia sinensis]
MDLASDKHIKKIKCKLDDDEPRNGMESLQPDIALDIFSRLPITSLLQFSSVNRSWQMLQYDPHLASLHFSRTAKNNPCLIFHCDYPIRNQLFFVELSDEMDNEIVRRIQTPFSDTMPEFNVIASCNGLLCLSDSLYSDPLYIYNRFTRKHKELPKSRQFDDQEVVFGFGFHPVTNEYKVVKIVLYWNQYNVFPRQHPRGHRIHDHTRSEVQVYPSCVIHVAHILYGKVYKELPKSGQFDDQELVFGFGFHPVTNEYKIVKITLFQNQRGRPEVQGCKTYLRIHGVGFG